jgi:hypothetical protein
MGNALQYRIMEQHKERADMEVQDKDHLARLRNHEEIKREAIWETRHPRPDLVRWTVNIPKDINQALQQLAEEQGEFSSDLIKRFIIQGVQDALKQREEAEKAQNSGDQRGQPQEFT